MRGRRRLIADEGAALFTIEAVMAGLLMLSALACLSALQPWPSGAGDDGLRLMTADLLNVLEHRENGQLQPNVEQALSSPDAWNSSSASLEADVREFLPAGCRFYLTTPYGCIGDRPPAGASMYARSFEALRQDTGEVAECSLIIWRG